MNIQVAGDNEVAIVQTKDKNCLNIISKVLERLLLARLLPHTSQSLCLLQSAYRQHHSAETALPKIANVLFVAIETGHVNIRVARLTYRQPSTPSTTLFLQGG